MFMGKHNHTIDPKGRLSIPSKFREVLGEEFVISKGMDGCLFVYPLDEWTEFYNKLKNLNQLDNNSRQFVRYFLHGAESVTVDKQGRILMPQHLKEAAGLEKDVVVAGAGTRVQIWDTKKYEKQSKGVDIDKVSKAMLDLGFSI